MDERLRVSGAAVPSSICLPHPRSGHPVNSKSVLLSLLSKPVVVNIEVLKLSRKLQKSPCQEPNRLLIIT